MGELDDGADVQWRMFWRAAIAIALGSAFGCSAPSNSIGPSADAGADQHASDGVASDAGGPGDGDAAGNDGVDRESIGFTSYSGGSYVPASEDHQNLLFAFTFLNHSAKVSGPMQSVLIWFEGDAPHAFELAYEGSDYDIGIGKRSELRWECTMYRDPAIGETGSLITLTDHAGSIDPFTTPLPFQPFGKGRLHFVARGTFKDGTPWETKELLFESGI